MRLSVKHPLIKLDWIFVVKEKIEILERLSHEVTESGMGISSSSITSHGAAERRRDTEEHCFDEGKVNGQEAL
jgi:hypothetical protein